MSESALLRAMTTEELKRRDREITNILSGPRMTYRGEPTKFAARLLGQRYAIRSRLAELEGKRGRD